MKKIIPLLLLCFVAIQAKAYVHASNTTPIGETTYFIEGYTLPINTDLSFDKPITSVSTEKYTASAPVNDNCENAIAISCGYSVNGTTVDATASGMGYPSCTVKP